MSGLQGVCDAVNLRHVARRQPSQPDLMHRWLLPPLGLREAFGYHPLPHRLLADPVAILDQLLVRQRSRFRRRR